MKIKGKTYAFNKKGIQVHGWRKIRGAYLYFRYSNGAGGYLKKASKVNGIRLDADGHAKPHSKRMKRKLRVMAAYSEWADYICRKKPLAPKKKKLKTVYLYLRKLPYSYVGELRKKDKNRDIWGSRVCIQTQAV